MSVMPNKRASHISRVEGPVFHESPVVNTELGPYIDREIPFEFEEPVYRSVFYDELSNDQKRILPQTILNQVNKYQHELEQGVRYLPDHHRPKIVLRQNIRDPSDLICTLHSNSRLKRTHDGISPHSEFEHPYFHNEEPHVKRIDQHGRTDPPMLYLDTNPVPSAASRRWFPFSPESPNHRL